MKPGVDPISLREFEEKRKYLTTREYSLPEKIEVYAFAIIASGAVAHVASRLIWGKSFLDYLVN